MPLDDFACRIRAARAYAGLSRLELAEHLEVSERTQINSELGQRHVPRPELLAIAEACEVPMSFLEGGWEGWRKGGRSVSEEGHFAANKLAGEKPPQQRKKTGGSS